MQIFCRFYSLRSKASGFLPLFRRSFPFLVAFLLVELIGQGGLLAPSGAYGQSACAQLGVDCSHRGSSGSGSSRTSDEASRQRRQAWAEWRAEQKAQREAQHKQEAVKQNDKGNKAYTAGDWKMASDFYKKAQKLSPNDSVIRQNLKNAQDALAREKDKATAAARQKAKLEAEQKELARKKEKDAKLERERQQQYDKDLQRALARLKGEQNELENEPAVWIEKNGRLVQQRLKKPNQWSSALAASLTTKAPPLPFKKFSELQSGDVLLIAPEKSDLPGRAVNAGDVILSGKKASDASHTVLYLKQINGVKFFLDNMPGEGPRIVPEAYFIKKYGHRQTEVAKLAQPLNEEEGKQLYAAAKDMRAKNLAKQQENNWFDKTNYGAWGKDNMVCAEADWALIKAAGRKIPESADRIKKGLGIDFSPADFYNNEQYFLVTPLAMPH
jgi:hypothetical protein